MDDYCLLLRIIQYICLEFVLVLDIMDFQSFIETRRKTLTKRLKEIIG